MNPVQPRRVVISYTAIFQVASKSGFGGRRQGRQPLDIHTLNIAATKAADQEFQRNNYMAELEFEMFGGLKQF